MYLVSLFQLETNQLGCLCFDDTIWNELSPRQPNTPEHPRISNSRAWIEETTTSCKQWFVSRQLN